MRYATNNPSDKDIVSRCLIILRHIAEDFFELNSELPPSVGKKMDAFKSSLSKVENSTSLPLIHQSHFIVSYGLTIRSMEDFPSLPKSDSEVMVE